MFAALALSLLAVQSAAHLPADCANAAATLEIDACLSEELKRERARMDHYLATARLMAERQDESTVGTPEASKQVRFLGDAQGAWEAYDKVVCNGVYDKWLGGSIRNAAALRCHIDMTRERTFVVWRDFIAPADSSEPELPDPRTTPLIPLGR